MASMMGTVLYVISTISTKGDAYALLGASVFGSSNCGRDIRLRRGRCCSGRNRKGFVLYLPRVLRDYADYASFPAGKHWRLV